MSNSAEENGKDDGESSDDLLPSSPVSNVGQRCGSVLAAESNVSGESSDDLLPSSPVSNVGQRCGSVLAPDSNVSGESSDDLLPSSPVSNVGQRCGSVLAAVSNDSRARVTASGASGYIDLAQPSTSTDIEIPDLSISSKNTKNGINYKRNSDALNGISQKPSTSSMSLGVKRKFVGNHCQTQRRKRQKMYHCKNTRQTGFKRKNTSGYSDIDTKRFKSEHARAAQSHTDKESTDSCSGSTYPSGETSYEKESTIASTSGEASNEKESRLASTSDETSDEEESEDVQPCPKSCICQAGPSQLPLCVERKFDTPAPLYKACLLRRMYSLSNTQYMCCKNRCVTKFSRERVMKVCLFHMEEDYYKSDLSVHQYKWGEWKD